MDSKSNSVAWYKVVDTQQINREDYERDLKRRQEEHLVKVGELKFK